MVARDIWMVEMVARDFPKKMGMVARDFQEAEMVALLFERG